jgi:hypothetical protein
VKSELALKQNELDATHKLAATTKAELDESRAHVCTLVADAIKSSNLISELRADNSTLEIHRTHDVAQANAVCLMNALFLLRHVVFFFFFFFLYSFIHCEFTTMHLFIM